ncbi:hypothetical protein TL16_g08933 [Triparma laevis f. inornata]|uniref:Uncharacterized protein n=1 Tax=Triparma laevis f. inornata TaxID=1714386 RepID=A0A9W7ELI2_9STRA|nr:hypothetical protein TL16_g08933 [Triparma laevis f. inornata]
MRTCGAHSWYKHMSLLNASYSFQFILKPYVNMRLIDNKYIEYLEDDGTRFHYTWTTTKKYRESYGILDYYQNYECDTWGKNDFTVIDYPDKEENKKRSKFDNELVRSNNVPVTSIIHSNSIQYYKCAWKLFKDGVDLRESSPQSLVEGTLSRRHYSDKDRLPETTIKFFEGLQAFIDLGETEERGHLENVIEALYPQWRACRSMDVFEVLQEVLTVEAADGKGHIFTAVAERLHQMTEMAKAIVNVYENVGAFEDGGREECERGVVEGLYERLFKDVKRAVRDGYMY